MWRKRRHAITTFRGLAVSGPHSRVPENATSGAATPWDLEQSSAYEAWAKRTAGLWPLNGRPTNESLGSKALDRPSAVSGARVLLPLQKNGGKSRLIGVFKKNGGGAGIYTRPLPGPWSGDVRPYVGMDEVMDDVPYDAAEYAGRAYIASRSRTPLIVTDGIARSVYNSHGGYLSSDYVDVTAFDAMIPAPPSFPSWNTPTSTVSDPGFTGSGWVSRAMGTSTIHEIEAFNGIYTYAMTFYRTWDGAESAPSPLLEIDVTLSGTPKPYYSFLRVFLPPPPDPRYGVDQFRIYRTTAGGTTLRFVAALPVTDSQFVDYTADRLLSSMECPTMFAIEDLRAASVCSQDGRLYGFNVSEDGTVVANRIRWSETGYPHVHQPLEYTDDVKGIGVAIRPLGRSNLLALTVDRAYPVENRGGGVHRVDDTKDWPGCVSVNAVCSVNEGVAWLSNVGLMYVDEYGRMQRTSSPELDRFFRGMSRESLADSALAFVKDKNAIVASIPAPESDGGRRLMIFDLTSGDFWIGPTSERIGAIASYPGPARIEVVGGVSADGTLHDLFTAPLVADGEVVIGPLQFSTTDEKRWRYMDASVRVRDTVEVELSATVDTVTRTKTETLSVSNGKALGQFTLGTDTLARPELKTVRMEIAARGVEAEVALRVTPTALPYEIESLTLHDQVPRAK